MDKMDLNLFEDIEVTLNGYPADFYQAGENRVMIIPKDLLNYEENTVQETPMVVVSYKVFKTTILNKNGKF